MSPTTTHTLASQRLFIGAALILSLVIFVVDLQFVPGYAIGMLYGLVILLGLWSPQVAFALYAAALATVLLMLDLALGWADTINPFVYVNRPLMTVTYWVAAVFVVRYRRLLEQAAAQLKQLENLKFALDQAAIVATTDVSGRITYVNDTFCAISKYSRAELIGQDHRIINSRYHPAEYIRDLWRTIANGRVWHGELRNRAKDGSYYWVDTTIVPMLDAAGKPYQYIAIRNDITRRKAMEAQLRAQDALARLGQMAAVVAHEVKNPIAGIKGVLEVMRSRRDPRDPDVPIMRDVVGRLDALNDLVQDLLLFARPRPPRMAPFDLLALIRDVLTALRSDPSGADVDVTVTGAPVILRGDGALLNAAILNLVLNAAQAMGGKGAIDIRVESEGPTARVSIRDQGPGIPPDLRDKVFEPFFTTKTRGGGLGLAIAVRSVELHGGSLSFECPSEGGTIMSVTLPTTPPSAAPAA